MLLHKIHKRFAFSIAKISFLLQNDNQKQVYPSFLQGYTCFENFENEYYAYSEESEPNSATAKAME